MSSYFVNSTFPVTLPGGQESFLGQIPLYSSGYTDPLRHYPGAAYGGSSVQEKAYPASFYQQANGAYGRATAAGPCDYATASFYREKDPACALASIEEHSFVLSQDHRKTDCTGSTGKSIYPEADEQKPSAPVYPWMQRMNSCNGKLMLSFSPFIFFLIANKDGARACYTWLTASLYNAGSPIQCKYARLHHSVILKAKPLL